MEHQVTISLLRQQIHALDELTRLIDKAGQAGLASLLRMHVLGLEETLNVVHDCCARRHQEGSSS